MVESPKHERKHFQELSLRQLVALFKGRIRRDGSAGATKWEVEKQRYAATRNGESFERLVEM